MLAGVALTISSVQANACGAEGVRKAGEYRKDLHQRWRAVRRDYQLVERRDYVDRNEADLEVSEYLGRVTDKSGKSYETRHRITNEVVLCTSTTTPFENAKGVFWLSRKRDEDGRYTLEDFSEAKAKLEAAE